MKFKYSLKLQYRKEDWFGNAFFFKYKYPTKRGPLVKYKNHPHLQGGISLPCGVLLRVLLFSGPVA